MEQQRYMSMRENPRIHALPNDAVVKSVNPIVDRFRAMLKERDEEFRVLADEDVPPPSTDEIVHLYQLLLSELTFNSKPIITDLTMIAGDHIEHGEGIADAICARIVEVPVEQKLPSLYLLDSIVKNIGKEYVRHFSGRLPEVFCAAYSQVNPNMHPSMRHLFGTWSAVFPPSVLRKIEAHLKFSQPVANLQSSTHSESPRPSHGIHVNPKYLEARRQLDHSAADVNIQHTRGSTSSSLKKPQTRYDRYDLVNTDIVMPSQVGPRGLRSANIVDKLPISSTARIARSSSPYRHLHTRSSSPAVEDSVIEDSPCRLTERVSPSHHRYEYNGGELDRPRALIDAYGIDHRSVKVNGDDRKPTWRNTEEEEFNWENMSPTFRGRSTVTNDGFPSSSSNQPSRSGQLASYENDLRRGNWPDQPSINSGRAPINNHPGVRNDSPQFPISHRAQESWNLPPNHVKINNFQSSFLPLTSTSDQQKPNSSNQDSLNPMIPPPTWPPTSSHKSLPLPILPPSFSIQKHYTNNNQFNPGFDPMNKAPQFPQIPVSQQQNFNHGYAPQGHSGMQMPLRLPLPPQQPSVGPATSSLQMMTRPPPNMGMIGVNALPGGPLSGLFNSLMSQGLISLTKQEPVQDAVGLDFNADVLKIRHESAITALYSDMPRQCTTCGLRFKLQEEHSSHMDWHVTKNRISKNRKQKPSRRWYVNLDMWLSSAESLGNDSVPGFVKPGEENVVEKNEEEDEISVPADEEQNTCALCGEGFDDFYSDETDEWMYKGAVYLNAPNGTGLGLGLDRSQLGPIVHAKCRPQFNDVSPQEFATTNDSGMNEDNSQRKRMKS